MSTTRDVVVVGAGHNGLIAACYLARAGLDVEVIERDTVAGGAVSTVQRWPGVLVDRGSSVHVMIRHTGIAEDLRLAELGLRYDDVEPWATVPSADGPLRFARNLDATCTDIEASCGAAAATAYRDLVDRWTPRMQAFLAAADGPPTLRRLATTMGRLYLTRPSRWSQVTHEFLEPAEAMLQRSIPHDGLRAAIGWWAAQSGPPPHEPGTAPMAGTLALLHLASPGRPRGGSGALSVALAARLESYGGALRLGDAVTTVERTGRRGPVMVRTESGEAITARAVVMACHAQQSARLLGDVEAAERMRVGHGIGIALRLLTDGLPSYSVVVPQGATSMQLLVRSTAQLRAAYGDFLRGEPPADPPLIVMTPTATDPTLAAPGRHVVTVWAQWYPYRLASGDWDSRREAIGDGILAAVDRWAPGFSSRVLDRIVQTPPDLERELGLVGGNVMHLEPGLDAMFGFRPSPGWSAYRSPMRDVYLAGASTHPGGGVWGASGRGVARLVARNLATSAGRNA